MGLGQRLGGRSGGLNWILLGKRDAIVDWIDHRELGATPIWPLKPRPVVLVALGRQLHVQRRNANDVDPHAHPRRTIAMVFGDVEHDPSRLTCM